MILLVEPIIDISSLWHNTWHATTFMSVGTFVAWKLKYDYLELSASDRGDGEFRNLSIKREVLYQF